jgi:hypothetical protein
MTDYVLIELLWDMKDNLLVAEFVILCWPNAENDYSGYVITRNSLQKHT